MAFTFSGNLGVNPTKPTKPMSVISSGLARDITDNNKKKLSSVVASIQPTSFAFPASSNMGVQPTRQQQGMTAGLGFSPTSTTSSGIPMTATSAQSPTRTNGQQVDDTSMQAQEIVSSNGLNPSLQGVVGDINKTISQTGYVSPEVRQLIDSINEASSRESMLLSDAQSANQTGDARALNDVLSQYEEAKKQREEQLSNLYSQLSGARADLTSAMAPTANELETQTKLADVQNRAREYALQTEQGVDAFEGQGRGIPLQLVRGQQKKFLEQRSYGERGLQNEEANLLTRLGLQQEARKISSDIAQARVKSIVDDYSILQKTIESQDDFVVKTMEKFNKLDENKRDILDSFIESSAGLSYDELDPSSRQYVNNLSANLGMPSSVVKDLMSATKNAMVLKQSMSTSGWKSTAGGFLNVNTGQFMAAPGTGASTDIPFRATIDAAASVETSNDANARVTSQLANLAQIGDYESLLTRLKLQARKSMTAESRTEVMDAENDVKRIDRMAAALQEYENQSGKTSFVKGKWSDINSYFGRLGTDPKFKEIATELQSAFQVYRQQMTGAAFGAKESAEYMKVVPSEDKSFELNLSVMRGMRDYLSGKMNDSYESVLGEGYRNVKGLAETSGQSAGQSSSEPETQLSKDADDRQIMTVGNKQYFIDQDGTATPIE